MGLAILEILAILAAFWERSGRVRDARSRTWRRTSWVENMARFEVRCWIGNAPPQRVRQPVPKCDFSGRWRQKGPKAGRTSFVRTFGRASCQ